MTEVVSGRIWSKVPLTLAPIKLEDNVTKNAHVFKICINLETIPGSTTKLLVSSIHRQFKDTFEERF